MTKGDAPWELTKLRLCRDVFHCTPSQLRRERFTDIMEALRVLNAEAEALDIKRQLDS